MKRDEVRERSGWDRNDLLFDQLEALKNKGLGESGQSWGKTGEKRAKSKTHASRTRG